jgi:hypothetical protein
MGAKQTLCAAHQQKPEKKSLKCGECNSYSQLQKKKAKPKFERDHIPSKAALREAAVNRYKPKKLKKTQLKCVAGKVEARGITVAIPKGCHRGFSPTCGSRNTKARLANDAKNPPHPPGGLDAARERDLKAMPSHLSPACKKEYAKAAKKIRAHDNEGMIQKALEECTS